MASIIDSILDRPVSTVSSVLIPPKPKTTSAVKGVPFKRQSPSNGFTTTASCPTAQRKVPTSKNEAKPLRSSSQRSKTSAAKPKNALTDSEKQLLRDANRGDIPLESVSGVVRGIELPRMLPETGPPSSAACSPPPSATPTRPFRATPQPHRSPPYPQNSYPHQPPSSQRNQPQNFKVLIPDLDSFSASSKRGRGTRGRGRSTSSTAGGNRRPTQDDKKPVIIGGVAQPRRPPPRPFGASAAPHGRGVPPQGHGCGTHSQGMLPQGRRMAGVAVDRRFEAERAAQQQMFQREQQMMPDSYGYEEDEGDDLDGFIDDGPLDPSANWRNELRNLTGYDPGRFRHVDSEEAVESSRTQQAVEERNSAKIAQREDVEELRKIQEEEARERKRRRVAGD